jgi:hypothetical protein
MLNEQHCLQHLICRRFNGGKSMLAEMIIFTKKINMKKEQILGVIRHALTFVGGLVVMKGLADAQEIETISGAIVTVFGGIWSILAKK